MKKKILTLIVCISAFLHAQAQETLTLEDAMARSLKNNFDIRLSKSQSQVATNSNTYGNAGFYPSVEADASYNRSVQNVKQHLITGQEQNRNGAQTNTLASGVELDYTVFNGFNMFVTKDKLQALDDIGKLNLRNQIDASMLSVVSAYFDVVRQQQQIKVTRESIKISQTKMDIAKSKYEVGASPKLDYLQSKVDLNNDSTNLMQQMAAVRKAKHDLNLLMGQGDGTADYNVSDTIIMMPIIPMETVKSNALKSNAGILSSARNIDANNFAIKQAESAQYPTVNLSSRYNFSTSQAQSGFYTNSQTLGLNYGASARINIFNGFTTKLAIQNAKIQADISKTQFDQQKAVLNDQINKAYEDYVANLNIVKLVNNNQVFATENLNIAYERFKVGKATIIDYRTAQLAYITSRNNLIQAIYNAKASEIQLIRLQGTITTDATKGK